MARRFAGSRRGGLQAPKRQIANDGVDTSNSTILTIGAAASGSILLGRQELAIPAATVVRTRGAFGIKWRSSGVVTNTANGAFGIIVVSNEAAVAGLASIPTPMDQIENDWLVYVPFVLFADQINVGEDDVGAYKIVDFDSRGMRKMKLGDSLQAVVEVFQRDATTGSIFDLSAQWRHQFKL